MTAQPSRRRFLKSGCITTAAIGAAVIGGGTLAATYQPPVDLPSLSYGESAMNQRILVTYSSKAGSTAGVAAKIGEILSKQNLTVDVLPVSKVTDLGPYSAVIAGSAIRMGRPLPEAMAFIEKHQQALQQKPFSVFVVCLTMKDDTEANRATVSAYLDPIRALVKPASEGLFAGAMIGSKVGLLERLMMMAMKAPEGDFRNWDQISAWAQSAPAAMKI